MLNIKQTGYRRGENSTKLSSGNLAANKKL